jgi:hypothetical protein
VLEVVADQISTDGEQGLPGDPAHHRAGHQLPGRDLAGGEDPERQQVQADVDGRARARLASRKPAVWLPSPVSRVVAASPTANTSSSARPRIWRVQKVGEPVGAVAERHTLPDAVLEQRLDCRQVVWLWLPPPW